MKNSKQNPLRVAGTAVLSALLAAGVLLPAVNPGTASADPTAAELQAEAESVLASLNEMQEQLNQASDDYYTALEEQAQAQQNMEDAQQRIDEATEEIEELQDQLSDRARSMYKTGTTTLIDVLLGSSTFSEFVNNWNMIDKINQSDSALVEQTKALREQIEEEKAVYAEQEELAATKAAEAKVIQEEAEATVASMQETYDNLTAEAEALLEEERAAQEAAEAAAAAAVLAAAAETAAATNASNGYSGSEPEYNEVTGNAIVDRAYSYVGNAEYVWGACSPGQFDCSGFVSYCLTGSYTRLGTTYTFLNWPRVSDPQPGDVAVSAGHCGIYIGNGQMIHCATYGVGVIIGPVQSGMVFVRYSG